MTHFFNRAKKSAAVIQSGDYSMGHTSYSGPSLMLASSQIRNGLLDSTTLTNSEFFYDVSREQEAKDSRRDRSDTKPAGSPLSETLDDADCLVTINAGSKMCDSLRRMTEGKLSRNCSKKWENMTDSTNCQAQLLGNSPASKCASSNDRRTVNVESGNKLRPNGISQKFQTSLDKLKSTIRSERSTSCAPACIPSCECSGRTRILIIVIILLLLVIISVIILCLAFTIKRPKSEPNSEPVQYNLPPPISYVPMESPKFTVPIQHRICLNSSCLRVASVIAERLEYFNSPDGFKRTRGTCNPSELQELTEILAYGDRPGFFVGQNSVGMMQQRLLHSVWSSISEALQNITPSRYMPMWIKKLSFLYRKLLTRGTGYGDEFRKHASELLVRDYSLSSSDNHLPPEEKNVSVESDIGLHMGVDQHLTLDALLQRGNIAFHGLDNVLISVQLELRVPLFFSTWISKSQNPGMLDTRIPVLDTLKQPDWFNFEEQVTNGEPLIASQQWRELQIYAEYLQRLVRSRTVQTIPMNSIQKNNISHWPAALSVLNKLLKLSRESMHRKAEQSKLTMRELMRRAQQAINIPRYLGALLSKNRSVLLPRDLAILVTDVTYFEKLGALLSQTSYSDLQDYVTFSILHKYASYVDDEAATLKRNLLKPLAERFGMQHVDNWPLLLDLASPGFRMLVLQQWSIRNLERSSDIIQAQIFKPLREEIKALASLLITDHRMRKRVLDKLETLKIQFTEPNFKNKIETFYDSLEIKPNRNLLSQIVDFHQFMSMKALTPDYSLIFGDCGLSSEGQLVSMYLSEKNIIELSILLLQWPYFAADLSVPNYINFGPVWYSLAKSIVTMFQFTGALHSLVTLDELRTALGADLFIEGDVRKVLLLYNIKLETLSTEDLHLLTGTFVAMEAVGKACRNLDETRQLSSEPRLSGVDLPSSVTFYLWLFQSICEKSSNSREQSVALDECTAARIAAQMSPTFRELMLCPDAPTVPDNLETNSRISFGQKSFYPSRVNRPINTTRRIFLT